MMPHLESTAPCFSVSNVGQTMRWYEELLGFKSYPFPANEPHAFAILQRDDIEIMLQQIENYQKPALYHLRSVGVWDAYIRMRGVKQLYNELREKVEILRPLQKQPYGDWEFEVKDPNGYVLVFSELIRAD
jgi:uncharacterized glyoxalase superfamily protein PhnB